MRDGGNDTLARQWAMLRNIPRMPRKVSAPELCRTLERLGFQTSLRTVERDLDGLSCQFPLVVDDSSRPYGWSWAKDADIELAPRLSPSQAVALLLSRVHLRQFLPHHLLQELASVFAAAEREVASSGWKDWHQRTAILPTSMPLLAPKLSADVLEHVHSALALRRCLSGHYRSRGATSSRELTIHPLGLIVRGSIQYLVCTLRDYPDVRQLALHRLSHTQLLESPRKQPPGFDFGKYVASSASKVWAQGRIRLVARFSDGAGEHLRETPVSTDQELIDVEGTGELELRATVESDETLRWWLLGFGSQVEVLKPRALRAHLKQELRAAAERYGDGE